MHIHRHISIITLTDKPTIDVEQTFIHTKEADETEVVCIVHASPRATVEWLRNGVKLLDHQVSTTK